MSLVARLSRAAATLSVPSLEPGVIYGQQGEDEVGRIIDQIPGSFRLANPIVPHAHTGIGVLEADHRSMFYDVPLINGNMRME
jgi:hypothetical protein